MNISGGSAAITGAAEGFGGATTRRLAKMGASVFIADVADDDLGEAHGTGHDGIPG